MSARTDTNETFRTFAYGLDHVEELTVPIMLFASTILTRISRIATVLKVSLEMVFTSASPSHRHATCVTTVACMPRADLISGINKIYIVRYTILIEVLFREPTKYECTCNPGFFGDGFVCTPERNCINIPSLCDPNAQCVSTTSGYQCACNQG